MVAAALHGDGQLVCPAEGGDEQGDKQGDQRLGPLDQVARLKIRPPGPLGGHDLVRLLDQQGDEAQGDGHHHGQLMDRHMDLFQRAQQVLQPVGEQDGGGGVGQQEGAGNEHQDADHHEESVEHALQRDGEDPEADQHRVPRRVEQVEDGGEDDDEHHRLHAPENGLHRHLGDGDGHGQQQEHDAVSDKGLGQEQGHDIQHHRDQLGAGVQAVDDGIAGEVLPQRDILQSHLLHPLFPKPAQNGLLGLGDGVDGGVDVHAHGPQAAEHPGHLGHAQPHALQFRTVAEHLPGRALKGDAAVVDHHQPVHRAGHLLHGVGDQDDGGIVGLVIVPDVAQDGLHSRIYYLDVKKNRKDEMFLAITESKKVVTGEGEDLQVSFEKHKIFLYREDFEKFMNGLNEAIDFINRKEMLEVISDMNAEADENAEAELDAIAEMNTKGMELDGEIKIDIDFEEPTL